MFIRFVITTILISLLSITFIKLIHVILKQGLTSLYNNTSNSIVFVICVVILNYMLPYFPIEIVFASVLIGIMVPAVIFIYNNTEM